MKTNSFSDRAKFDIETVQNAVNGDEKAYAVLLERYYDSIYFMLLNKIKSETDAEDLTMETFAKAFNNLNQYSPVYAFSTWIFRIAINKSIDHIRKQKSRPQSKGSFSEQSEEYIDSLEEPTLNPEEKAIKNQKSSVIKELIKTLKPRYAQLLDLRYYKELSYEEISDEMNIPIGTVKSQLYRAKMLLLALLKPRNENF